MNQLPDLLQCSVAIIGLGYVGLPLAVEFAKPQKCCITNASLSRCVIGFDISDQRLSQLRLGFDCTNEITEEDFTAATNLVLTSDTSLLAKADVFIVTVPTPIDLAKRPDLTALSKASATVGKAIAARKERGTSSAPVIIYESTVYPGATEEVCIPIIEEVSQLKANDDFFFGYSPERINPGDTSHRLTSIKKVTSGSTVDSAQWINSFYASIISAGTYLSPCIKVAEAAKVIENTQRDLNIALVNELSIIFSRLGIDTLDVLEAAGTKWNFLPFRPGLVGGHCIGVDPYYLTHKAQESGYYPEVVLAGRRINDGMSRWIADQLLQRLAQRQEPIAGTNVLILGLTFKENCPDLRNTKVIDLIRELQRFSLNIHVVDPFADPDDSKKQYGIDCSKTIAESEEYGVVVVAVAHQQFVEYSLSDWRRITSTSTINMDLKGIVPRQLGFIRM